MARNPKDVCVSSYHYYSSWFRGEHYEFEGDFENLVEGFMRGYFVYSPYWEHLRQAWGLRDHPNLHFMFYEDMKADKLGQVKKLNTFLELNLTDEQLNQ